MSNHIPISVLVVVTVRWGTGETLSQNSTLACILLRVVSSFELDKGNNNNLHGMDHEHC